MYRAHSDFNKPCSSRYVFVPKRKIGMTPQSVSQENDADSTFEKSVERGLNDNIVNTSISSVDHSLVDAAPLEQQDSDQILSNVPLEQTPVKLMKQLSKINIESQMKTVRETLVLEDLPENCFLPDRDINAQTHIKNVTIRRPVVIKKEPSQASTVNTLGSINIAEVLEASAREADTSDPPATQPIHILSDTETPPTNFISIVPETDSDAEADDAGKGGRERVRRQVNFEGINAEERTPRTPGEEAEPQEQQDDGTRNGRPRRRRESQGNRDDSQSSSDSQIEVRINVDVKFPRAKLRNQSRRRTRTESSPENDTNSNQKKRPKVYIVVYP